MRENFGLYLILTDPVAGYERAAEVAVSRRVRYLQLRMKRSSREVVLEKARALREITRGTDTHFIVNDDVTIAAEADADGVHLGQEDMSLAEARRLWNTPGKVFGLSTHCATQAARAVALAPDYIGVGPVFATPTKARPDPTLGLEYMREIIQSSPLTTVAIGGVNLDNLASVLSHGARNFAVVRAVNASAHPEREIAALQDEFARIMSNPPRESP